MKKVLDSLCEFEGNVAEGELLSKHTYYRIGGPAEIFVEPKSLKDLKILSQIIADTQIPYTIIGAGSNILVSDQGFKGLVIKTKRLNLEVKSHVEGDQTRVTTGCSVQVSTLLGRAGREGWGGFEFLAGIPGTVGGVVTMNGGTHLGEAKDRLCSVDFVAFEGPGTGPVTRFSGEELRYTYRANHFLPENGIVWAAEWRVDRKNPDVVKQDIQEVLTRRKSTQPIELPSCGSVFKNPKSSGLHSWQVIEKLGLRGHRVGGACYSQKHSNFIVNDGKAKASDVRALIDLAKTRAKAELQIDLEEEVRYIGEF